MQSRDGARERKGTGRPLATKSRRPFSASHPHSYGPSLSHDSAALDALRRLFPSATEIRSPTPSISTRNHSRSPRPRSTPSSSSSSPSSAYPSEPVNPFLSEMDPFAHLPPQSDDEQDEEEGDAEATGEKQEGTAPEEASDDEAALTREPFYAPTPSRLSTASSSSSTSARSRSSGGRPASMSPARSRASVSKKLDMTEEEEEREKEEEEGAKEEAREEAKEEAKEEEAEVQSAQGRRSSRRSTRGPTADEDEEPMSSSRGGRRSSAGKEEKVEAQPEEEQLRGEADGEAEAVDSKYDVDGADGGSVGDADDGAAMDFNDPNPPDDDAPLNGVHNDNDDDEAQADLPTSSRVSFSASSSSPPKPTAPKRSRAKSSRRRETTKLVEDAQRLGFLEEDLAEEGEGFGRRGRPRRHRIEPLKYWENEHVEYERTRGGLGNVMPVPRSVVRAMPASPVKRKGRVRRRPAADERKKTTKRKAPVLREEDSSPDTGEGEEAKAFGGSDLDADDLAPEQSALVHTPNHEEIHKGHTPLESTRTHPTPAPSGPTPLSLIVLTSLPPGAGVLHLNLSVVAKTKSRLPLEYLSQPLSSSSTSSPIPLTQLPKGGKAFEEKEFSSGVLVLPPLSKKQHEQTCTVESFVILSAAPRSLQVTIGPQGTAFRLSKGDHFVVPLGNVYSLHNLSDSKAVEVYFHLITSKEDVEREVRERMRQEMEELDNAHAGGGGGAGGGGAAGKVAALRGKGRGGGGGGRDGAELAVLN